MTVIYCDFWGVWVGLEFHTEHSVKESLKDLNLEWDSS